MENNPGISLFQSSGITIENPLQNQEEDEDIEEQKRRQEEIQNFLTTAMDEFNYDDQSTINSSTNVSVDEKYNHQSNLSEKYRTANVDDHLKVLYEIRVREINSLTEQLENLQKEIEQEKKHYGQSSLLLEAEKDKAKISLKQAQSLLVDKTEEISKLKNEIDALRNTVISLEATTIAVNDEYTLCKHSNKELLDQLALMHNGLTTNTISDRQLQEQHHSEVNQLHHLLDSAHMKLHRKEKECKQLEHRLKETTSDKDVMITEKASIINQLTQNLEDAQLRCQEFSEMIEKVSKENNSLKLSTTVNDLTDTIKSVGLSEKTEIVKALQNELNKAHNIRNTQQANIQSLQETCEKLSSELDRNIEEKKKYQDELIVIKGKHMSLNDDFVATIEELKQLKIELEKQREKAASKSEIYENKIKLLQETLQIYEHKQNLDHSVQVSFSDSLYIDKEENQRLKNQVETLNDEITVLTRKLLESDSQLSQMKLAISLQNEREILIKTLEEKAAKFEEIIKQRQSRPECASIAINTDTTFLHDPTKIDKDLLLAKYEKDLVQKEIEIRTQVKKDFDIKLEKIQNELSKKMYQLQEKSCEHCKDLANSLNQIKILMENRDEEIKRLTLQMKQDREAVATLLEEWGNRFIEIESDREQIYGQYEQAKMAYDQLLLKLKTREAGDSKLYGVIKKECEETIKLWNRNTIENLTRYTLSQRQKIEQSNKRIEQFSKHVDKEIHTIEMQYLKKKQLLEHNRILTQNS